jgi:hypothetical protein
MSIETDIERNRKKNTIHPKFLNRLLPVTKEQSELTKRWILKYQEEILNDVRILRTKADKTLTSDPNIIERTRIWKRKYPKGFCHEIRDEVFRLIKDGMLNRDMQGLQAMKNFVREGGVIQKFWGIGKDMYFQNAIQIGDSILDVANDTVDHTKEPVVFYPSVYEAPIRRIENFDDFASVAEKYQGKDVYPNIYFPWLAPVFPVLTIIPPEKTRIGKYELVICDDTGDLLTKNFYDARWKGDDASLFGLSSDFLTKGHYAHKRLPKEMLDNLLNDSGLSKFSTQESKLPDMFRVSTDPEDALAEIAHFHINDKESEEDMSRHLKRYMAETLEKIKVAKIIRNIVLAKV